MMTQDEQEELVRKCIEAHEAVMDHGTPEMQAFSKALMYALAKLVADDIFGAADGHGTA